MTGSTRSTSRRCSDAATFEPYLTRRPRALLPQLGQTERPDKFAGALLDGCVGLLVDGLPMGYLLPTTFRLLMHTPEDEAHNYLLASALIVLRYFAFGAVADVSGAVRGRGDVPPGNDPGKAAAVGHPGKAAGAVFRAGDHSVHAHRLRAAAGGRTAASELHRSDGVDHRGAARGAVGGGREDREPRGNHRRGARGHRGLHAAESGAEQRRASAAAGTGAGGGACRTVRHSGNAGARDLVPVHDRQRRRCVYGPVCGQRAPGALAHAAAPAAAGQQVPSAGIRQRKPAAAEMRHTII